MPGQIRPNEKLMRAAYKILQTPTNMQQRNEKNVSEKRQQEWAKESVVDR